MFGSASTLTLTSIISTSLTTVNTNVNIVSGYTAPSITAVSNSASYSIKSYLYKCGVGGPINIVAPSV